MAKLFISYRRADTEQIAGRIHDRLTGRFAAEDVFLDVDSIPQGVDFHHHIDSSVRRCQLLVALIGPNWLEAGVLGAPRIQSADDFVRIELETAFDADIPVLPVLIGRAGMPQAGDLPSSLIGLTRINAAQVDPGRDFNVHMQRVIETAERMLWSTMRTEDLHRRLARIDMRSTPLSAAGLLSPTAGSATKRDTSGMSAEDKAFLDAMWEMADQDARASLLLDELVALDKGRDDGVSEDQLARYRALVFGELERCNARKDELQRKAKAMQQSSTERLREIFKKSD